MSKKKQSRKEQLKDKIKEGISFVESSGRENPPHRTLASGMHKGYSAFGKYGLMPLTTQEYAKKLLTEQPMTTPAEMMKEPTPEDFQQDKEFMRKRKAYDQLANIPLTPTNQQELKDILLKQPDINEDIADRLLQTIERRAGPSEEAAVINWEKGQYRGTPSLEEQAESDRVRKYKEYFENKAKSKK